MTHAQTVAAPAILRDRTGVVRCGQAHAVSGPTYFSSSTQAGRMRKAGTLMIIPSWTLVQACVDGSPFSSVSARLADRGALGIDTAHQLVPGFDEG